MRRLITGPTNLALFQNFARAGKHMHAAPIRTRRNAFQLLRRRMAPIHMRLRDNLPRVRQAATPRIPRGNRLAGRKCKRRPKTIKAVRRVG